MKNKQNTQNPEFMTVTEVGAYLNISLSKAYALTRREDFPICRFGGSIRIPSAAFMVWVEKMTSIPRDIRVRMEVA